MHVTMVKKRLLSGDACKKCVEAEDLLRGRGLWGRIDRVVWAVEGEPASEGMQLGQRFGMANAPFFVVRDEQGHEEAVASTLKLLRTIATSPEPEPAPVGDMTRPEAEALVAEFAQLEPQDSLRRLLTRFGKDCSIAFSGAEDVVLIDMAVHSGLEFSVFCLDTGRLHPETYRFVDKVRSHYGIEIELYSPQPALLQPFVRKKGLFSFYEDGHGECCGIRKIDSIKRALLNYRAWVTGQRRDQSPDTRAAVPVLQVDAGNASKPGSGLLLKANPLANWSSAQVWSYIRERSVPYNELHERGYISLGCEPCTRPVQPGEHERAGRWWWEEATKKECGLHITTAPTPHGEGI
jgi:phosphoadenosine phosphosulfate reductase